MQGNTYKCFFGEDGGHVRWVRREAKGEDESIYRSQATNRISYECDTFPHQKLCGIGGIVSLDAVNQDVY